MKARVRTRSSSSGVPSEGATPRPSTTKRRGWAVALASSAIVAGGDRDHRDDDELRQDERGQGLARRLCAWQPKDAPELGRADDAGDLLVQSREPFEAALQLAEVAADAIVHVHGLGGITGAILNAGSVIVNAGAWRARKHNASKRRAETRYRSTLFVPGPLKSCAPRASCGRESRRPGTEAVSSGSDVC
mgnify:CR=1 FL=1